MPRFVRSLDPAQRQKAFEHTFEAWSEGRSPEEHRAYQEEQLARGAGVVEYAGLVDDDGRLLASMKRFSLSMRRRSEALPTLGIGALMVPPDLRKRGLGRDLVNAAIDDARSQGMRAAWLFSEIDPAYYERLGFQQVPFRLAASEIEDLPDEVPSGFSVSCGVKSGEGEDRLFASAGDEEDGAAFLDAARFVVDARALHPARSRAARGYFAWRNGLTYVSLWSAAGVLRGYVALGSMSAGPHPALEVCEWASAPSDETALISALRSVAISWGASRVVGSIESLLASACDLEAGTKATTLEITNERYGVPMVRSIDPSCAIDCASVHVAIADYF